MARELTVLHLNLALVCVMTDRAFEAQRRIPLAEQARFTVNPELNRRTNDALAARPKQTP